MDILILAESWSSLGLAFSSDFSRTLVIGSPWWERMKNSSAFDLGAVEFWPLRKGIAHANDERFSFIFLEGTYDFVSKLIRRVGVTRLKGRCVLVFQATRIRGRSVCGGLMRSRCYYRL